MQFVAGADTMRNGYPGYVVRRHVRPGPRLVGPAGGLVLRRRARRGRPRCRSRGPRSWRDCATSRSSSAPTPRRRASSRRTQATGPTIPTGCGSGCSAPPTRRTSRCYARRRMDLYGATEHDFAKVKVKNARHGLLNPNARYRKEVTEDEVLASPMVASPLHLLDICATSDGGAAIVVSSMEFARRHGSTRARCGCAASRPSRRRSRTRSSRCRTSPPTRRPRSRPRR